MISALRPFAVALTFALVVPAGIAKAQKAAAQIPNFDVVSIRPNHTGSGSVSMSVDEDHFELTNVTLKDMLREAYNVRPAQLINLPSWATSERFDVKGKVVDPDLVALRKMAPEERRPMFQVIMRERFGLQFHSEPKSMPVYELTVAKGGPKMKALPELTEAQKIAGDDKDPGDGTGRGSMNVNHTDAGILMSARGVKVIQLVASLSTFAGRTVLDKTGLTADYTFDLHWLPEENAATPRADAGTDAEPPPSLFTAIQEQLGLRLVATKGDVDTMVIDHVDHPTEN